MSKARNSGTWFLTFYFLIFSTMSPLLAMDCDEYTAAVAASISRKMFPIWHWNPLARGKLRKQIIAEVTKEFGDMKGVKLTDEQKEAIDAAVLRFMEDYESRSAGGLGARAWILYAGATLGGTGGLMLTDAIDEPYRTVARFLILSIGMKLLQAASAPVDGRINGQVTSFTQGRPSVVTRHLPPDVSRDALRAFQQAPRVMRPNEWDGLSKLLDAVGRLGVLLGHADNWAERGQTERAANHVKEVVRIYLQGYGYLNSYEPFVSPLLQSYLVTRDSKFREMVYDAFKSDNDKIEEGEKEKRVDLKKVNLVLDAWMPHTKKKTAVPTPAIAKPSTNGRVTEPSGS